MSTSLADRRGETRPRSAAAADLRIKKSPPRKSSPWRARNTFSIIAFGKQSPHEASLQGRRGVGKLWSAISPSSQGRLPDLNSCLAYRKTPFPRQQTALVSVVPN